MKKQSEGSKKLVLKKEVLKTASDRSLSRVLGGGQPSNCKVTFEPPNIP